MRGKLRFGFAIALALLIVVPVSAYVTLRQLSNTQAMVQIKWSNGAFPLKWQINPAITSNFSGSTTFEDALKASFATWTAVPTAESFVCRTGAHRGNG